MIRLVCAWVGRWLCSYEIHDTGTAREGQCLRGGAEVSDR